MILGVKVNNTKETNEEIQKEQSQVKASIVQNWLLSQSLVYT